MQHNNKAAGSQRLSLSQIYALFRSSRQSETLIRGFLFLVGIILTPISLLGALIGLKRAHVRFGLPQGRYPTLSKLPAISWVAMFLGVVVTWLLFALLATLVTAVAGTFMGKGAGAQVVIVFVAFNLVCSVLLFSHFRRWQGSMASLLEEQGRFGSAKLATPADLADLERQPGLYIGGDIYGYNKMGHRLLLGGARGGKGVNVIMPNLLTLGGYDGSWCIIDVKGELAAVTARAQKEQGQEVFILDPWSLNTANGATYNPLDLVAEQTNPDSLIDDISIIAEMIVPKETKGDEFWTNKARSLVSGLILHLMMTEARGNRTLTKLWEWLRLPQEAFEELLTDMAVSDSAVVRATGNEYANIMHTSARMFQSILSSAQEKTDFLKSPALQKSLASSSFDVKNITNGKTTLYVIIPPDKLDSHYQWLRLVMTTALRSSVRNHNKRITFLLDEFAALGYLPEIRTALSTYAGYNITMWPVVQDLGQLKNLYGDSWETFISNTAVRQFLSVSDVFSLEYLSKVMGTTTTTTYDANDPSGKAQSNARPLMTPDEIRRVSANNILTMVEQRPVAILPKIPYFDMPTLQGKYDPNPYYK